MAKTKGPCRIYSAEFKKNAILDMHQNKLSYFDAVRKHWGSEAFGREPSYIKSLRRWEQIYFKHRLEENMELFQRKRIGRPPKNPKQMSEVEKLKDANLRLEMELEYLKKLSALVLAEEREKNKKQK